MPQPQHEIVNTKIPEEQNVLDVLISQLLETIATSSNGRTRTVALCVVTGLLVTFCESIRSITDSVWRTIASTLRAYSN
jgi:hypothetical protein